LSEIYICFICTKSTIALAHNYRYLNIHREDMVG